MPYCSKCGTELSSEDQFCSNCGEPVQKSSEDKKYTIRKSAEVDPSDSAKEGREKETTTAGPPSTKTPAEEEADPFDTDLDDEDGSRNWAKIAAYGVSIWLFLAAIGFLQESILSAVAILIGAIIALPLFRRWLHENTEFHLSRVATIIIVISCVLMGGVVADIDGDDEDADALNSEGGVQVEADEADTGEAEEDVDDAGEESDEGELSNAEILSLFETNIQNEGVDVDYTDADYSNRVVYLDHYASAPTEEAIAGDIGTVAGTYAGTTVYNWDIDRVEVSILEADGSLAGTYYIEREWAAAYANDEMTDGEYLDRISNTIETNQ